MVLKRKNRFYDTCRFGQPEIRVFHRKGTGKKSPRYLLKCGCCDEKLKIYYFYCNRFILSLRDEAEAGTGPCGRASGRFSPVRFG